MGMAASRVGIYTINAPRTSVIGPYRTNPNYIDIAKNIGGNYFKIPQADWDAMSTAEKIFANKVFLDDAVERGDTFSLSVPSSSVNPISDTAEEIKYILGQPSKFGKINSGYSLSSDEMQLNPPN